MADILATFRALAPEFAAKTDADVNAMIEIAKPHVSASRFGSFYEQAVAYRAAHEFALQALVQSAGSTGAALTAGALTGEREGDLQRTYNIDMSNRVPDLLDRTYYGKQFKALVGRCGGAIMTRMG